MVMPALTAEDVAPLRHVNFVRRWCRQDRDCHADCLIEISLILFRGDPFKKTA